MTVSLQPAADRIAFYRKEHERAVAAGTHFDPLEMDLRGEFEVCAHVNRWGQEWTISGGVGFPKISRPIGKHEQIEERDPMDLSQEAKAAQKYYVEWLRGDHDEATRIQDPVTLRTARQKIMDTVAQGVPYDPSNPDGTLGLKANPGPMNWGDRADYVPSPAQVQKRQTLESNVKFALAERRHSMDTIAAAANCDRDYVRQISKHFCTPEEHKANLKREDS